MLNNNLFPETPFWDFSAKIYASQDVALACLGLQENLGVDVNILLFGCWCAAEGYPLISDEKISEISANVNEFYEQVVKKMRVARTILKGGYAPLPRVLSAALRKNIVSLEIDCEHAEQILLVQHLDSLGNASGVHDITTGVDNLKAYLRSLDAVPDEDDWNNLATLLAAAFPGTEHRDAVSLLARK